MKALHLVGALVALTILFFPSASAASNDLTVVGVSSTDGSSIRLGIEPTGAVAGISFQNVTWYIYGSGEISESIDGNITAHHQVDGLLIVKSFYEPGRHVIAFSSDGSMQQFILQVSSSATSIDWDELSGAPKDPIGRNTPEMNVWLVTLAFFVIPFPFVLRRVRKIKRSEVSRVL